ncbi:MAG TPA: L-threonylcarbamoyladenylate synthase [Kofleriaceae bacterium]|nr:L-threonylcarbamoyladenylate synthase [Kofleriaceae bacterium]
MTLDPISEAAAALAAGGVVCIPTESTYGLAADIRSPPALHALGVLKQTRPADAPYPLIAPDLAAARALARVWPAAAEELAARHWPGPLTLVVPARADLPPELVGAGGGVGVRVSSHPLAAALARAVGAPITATSANRSTFPPATTMQQARAVFGAEVACYLDGGVCQGTPSTVVAVDESGALRVIRAGAVALSP